MINVLCFVDGVNKPKKHTKCMAKVNTLLKNEGHNVHLGYISLTGLEALDKRGVNSMSEMVPGKRAWLIVYVMPIPVSLIRMKIFDTTRNL